jgi:hypothetical protein
MKPIAISLKTQFARTDMKPFKMKKQPDQQHLCAAARPAAAPPPIGAGSVNLLNPQHFFHYRIVKRRPDLLDQLRLVVGPSAIGEKRNRDLSLAVDPQ